jgi:hypothetical protein
LWRCSPPSYLLLLPLLLCFFLQPISLSRPWITALQGSPSSHLLLLPTLLLLHPSLIVHFTFKALEHKGAPDVCNWAVCWTILALFPSSHLLLLLPLLPLLLLLLLLLHSSPIICSLLYLWSTRVA